MEDAAIRSATQADWPALSRSVQALREHIGQFFPVADWQTSSHLYLAEIQKNLTEKEGAVYIAEKDGIVCGHVFGWITDDPDSAELHPQFRRRGYIDELFVFESCRYRGIGRALLGMIVEDLKSKQVSHIGLGVLLANAQAVDFYKKCGFQPYFTNMKINFVEEKPYLLKKSS